MSEYLRMHSFLGDNKSPAVIRILIPYQYLMSYNQNVLASYDFLLHQEKDYYDSLNVLQFQRSATLDQLNLIKNIKNVILKDNKETKIVYEVDDLLLDMSKFNRTYQYYNHHRNSVIEILKTVDYIVTSTHELAKHLSKYNNNKVKVIKNRLSKPLYYSNNIIKLDYKKPKILWTGSDSHQNDFNNDLINFIKKTRNIYEWIFFGYLPFQLSNIDNITHIKWIRNYYEYVLKLKEINPTIAIAPLEINDFNKCKSNLKALEYIALNIPSVYTNITPYRGLNLTSKNNNKFIDMIQELVNDEKLREETILKDYNNLKDELYWDDKYAEKYFNTYF